MLLIIFAIVIAVFAGVISGFNQYAHTAKKPPGARAPHSRGQ
jgi:hypothetical protein